MRHLNWAEVLVDNHHFNPNTVRVKSTSRAWRCDPWAAERGYTFVVAVTDGRWVAEYGFYKPTREWHLWAN
jgi:hypothetical protein